jgi:hypothetical protein
MPDPKQRGHGSTSSARVLDAAGAFPLMAKSPRELPLSSVMDLFGSGSSPDGAVGASEAENGL